jgi:hypothetical protein
MSFTRTIVTTVQLGLIRRLLAGRGFGATLSSAGLAEPGPGQGRHVVLACAADDFRRGDRLLGWLHHCSPPGGLKVFR